MVNRPMRRIDTEYEQRVLDIARVTRVVAGGKRLSFRAVVALGAKNGHQIGFGIGKGQDVSQAIEKAINAAKANMVKVPVVNGTIPFSVSVKYQAAKIILKPSQKGKGIIAGGAVRTLLKLANINNVTAKILGRTNNAINNAQATIMAMRALNIEQD